MKNWIEYYKLIAKENQFIKANISKYSSLTVKERILINHLANGCSIGDIAVQMGIKESTVRRYQYNVRKKLLELQHDLKIFAQVFELDE